MDENPKHDQMAQTPVLTRSWLPASGNSTRKDHSRSRFLLLLIAPVLLAVYLSAYLRGTNISNDEPQIANIDISKVLKQNLALANHSWEHGVLTHALLELQNPELTVFAGPGYGFDLRNPNPGARLEPFPGGKLPMCGRRGRYDVWTNVKGLRYAASKIETARPRGRNEKWWLYRGEKDGSAADAASLGWVALLLERAGADDPRNPVAVGRNAYGEAVDEMVDFLVRGAEKGGNMRFVVGSGSEFEVEALRGVGETAMGRMSWAVSHRVDSAQIWADFVFMVPPFLAAYAVARGEERWLAEAVEQIKAYADVLAVKDEHGVKGLWRHIVTQPRHLGEDVCCHDEGLWLTGNAWALSGMVRVLGVMERWQPRTDIRADMAVEALASLRQHGQPELLRLIHELLEALRYRPKQASGTYILENYLDIEELQEIFESPRPKRHDPAGTALIASSIYRLAQLGLLKDLSMLEWADGMYNAVARSIDSNGLLTPVASVTGVPSQGLVASTSEAQSFVALMYAARRDCNKLGICSKHMTRKK